MKILLADDDLDLLDVTGYALERDGFVVVTASNGEQALQRWEEQEPDVVILDVRMPRMSGIEVCRRIRERSETPVIMLSGSGDEDLILRAFELGADDYVTKPFSLRQLSARIQAVWRRGRADLRAPDQEIRIGDAVLDLDGHEVTRPNESQQLTRLEFRILHLLAVNMGRVVA